MMPKKTYRLSGLVSDQRTGIGIPKLRIEAWDKDLLVDDFVAEAITGEKGTFEIKFEAARFRELFLDREPDLYFRVYQGDKLIKSTEDSVLWNVKASNNQVVIELELPSGEAEEKKPLVVRGQVRNADGSFVTRYVEELLGETKTDNGGHYEIGYFPEQFRRKEKGNADLIIRAFDTEAREVATSPIMFNAESEATVDLVVGGDVYRGLSEYEQLVAELTPLLEGVSFSDLTEDDEHQDVSFLSGETGQDPGRITFLIIAQRLFKETDIPTEVFYGLFRQGLPTQLPDLLAESQDVQRRALVRSVQTNIIPPAFADETDSIIEGFRKLIVSQALKQPTEGSNGTATLNDLLRVNLQDAALREEFLGAYVSHTGPMEEFWKGLAARPEFKDSIENVQRTLQLGALTGNHLPLVHELQRMQQAGELMALSDLVRFDEDGWLEIIARDGGDGPIGVPPSVPGQDDNERARNYARAMSHLVEDAFPATFITRRLETDDLPGKEDLLAFFNANADFNVRSTRLESYLQTKPDAFANVQDPESTKTRIKALQRVYKLAPRYKQASALLKGSVDSAHSITRMGENVFLSTYGNALGGIAQAKIIYAKAQQVEATAMTLLAEYGPMSYSIELQVLHGSPVLDVEGVPEWSTLFGSLELCECDHCRSVYSPAAYLADVLHFLKDRPSQVPGKNAKDILALRRPDIGEIELTCENTNTPLPYVDLVNEALENAIIPFVAFVPFNLPAGVETDLNTRTLSLTLRNAFHPPLSTEAVITVGGEGQLWNVAPDWWTIDETAFTYTIRKENGQLRVITRSLQTKGSAAELAANPQYINANAYVVLGDVVYPWSLPFNLWAQEARAYLEHLGVPRLRIMESLHSGDRAAILADAALAHEHLGLTTAQANLITGVTTSQPGGINPGPWNLWGFEAPTLSMENSIPDPANSPRRITEGNWLDVIRGVYLYRGGVDVFLQQSGLDYKEMLDLLDTYYVNPLAGNVRKISIVSTYASNPDTCETDKLLLEGFDEDAAMRTVRFVRLRRASGWSMRDLDRALTAFAPADLDNAFLTRLSHVQRLQTLLNVPVLRLLSWWADLDHAFYLDHNATGQPRVSSLYDQLFRNRAVINPPDPAFTEHPTALAGTLSGHIAAITAALNISAADFALLLDDANVIPRAATDPTQPDDVLNLNHLSQLHRHASLAKALRLPMRDYLTALQLIATNPFATTTDTLIFVETVNEVRNTGFTITELAYLLRHAFTPESAIAPSDETIATLLDELRGGLQNIAEENTFRSNPDDPRGPTIDLNGDLTRQKLALLNWERALVDQAISTLNGSVVYESALAALPFDVTLPNTSGTYSVTLAALPVGFVFPPQLRDIMAYEAANQKLTAARLLSQPERILLQAAANAAGNAMLLNTVSALFQQMDELEGRISYDAQHQVLRFDGPMTNPRKARLGTTSNDVNYRNAVQALYDAPRRFINRAMRTFITHDFGTDLAALPVSVKFPNTLKRKIYFDSSADPKRLHCVGVMSETERDALLALSTNTADANHATYLAAVNALYAQAETLLPAPSDAFLTTTGPNNDAAALFDATVAPADRFLLVLRKLFPFLCRTLSEQVAVRMMAEALQLETRSADMLLRVWLASPLNSTRRCLQELLDPAFAESNTNVVITPSAFSTQFKTFLRAHKAAMLITRLKLTYRQIDWLFAYGPDAGWLDLNSLPTDAQETAATFDDWLRLAELARLRESLPRREKVLDELLPLVHGVATTAPATLKNTAKQVWFTALTRSTQWAQADLEVLLGLANDHMQTGVLNVTFPDDYAGERLLVRLREVFGLLKRLGMSAQQAAELVTGPVTLAKARGVRQIVRAKYDEAQWLNLAKPIRDVLREQQRAALVDYLVTYLKLPFTQLETPHPVLSLTANRPAVRELQQKLNAAGANPPLAASGQFGVETRDAVFAFQFAHQTSHGLLASGAVDSATWAVLDLVRYSLRDANDLYAYFLIDVEMDPCMMTSRIKQAISSAQLFVQRCLMKLEPDVAASAAVDVKWLEWKWMKNYRVWEANRKIFLYAENWIEPELRDDKSPFFVELESELLQSDLTLETAEDAFLHYLEKLDQVAQLEVVAIYHQLEKDSAGNTAVDVLHTFARTTGIPHIYYYRQRVDSAYWTAWERLDLDIEGDHLIPTIWNRRLILFWPILTEKARELQVTFSGGSLSNTQPTMYWEIKLAWTERKQGKWTNKKVSSEYLDFDKESLVTVPNLGGLGGQVVNVHLEEPADFFFRSLVDNQNNLYILTLFRDLTSVHYAILDLRNAFRFDGCNADPIRTLTPLTTAWTNLLQMVTGTGLYRMFLREDGDKQLYLPAPSDTTALAKTPGTFLLLPYPDGSSIAHHPFFYRDDKRSFFVIPSDEQAPVWNWSKANEVDPGLVIKISKYYLEEVQPIPDPSGPIINPEDPGVYDLSFPVLAGKNLTHFEGGLILSADTGSDILVKDQRVGISSKLAKDSAPFAGGPLLRAMLGAGGVPVMHMLTHTGRGVSSALPLETPLASDADVSKAAAVDFGWLSYRTENRFLFQTFYHPYVCAFVCELNRNGVDGLLQRRVQTQPHEFAPRAPNGQTLPALDFKADYEPDKVSIPIVLEPYPVEDVDFNDDGAYALYNWELFFHAPLMIADRLSKNQRYEEAQKWFHTIFDPTDKSSLEIPQRYWRTKPFHERTREGYQHEQIQYILTLLTAGADPQKKAQLSATEKEDLERFEKSVTAWRKDPFKPHLIARMRTTAYQKMVVMKYIDNLIGWADQLFRRDTLESINEATQLYILAAEILGHRPYEVPPRAAPRVQTFNSLEPILDAFSNATVQIEEFVSPSANGGAAVGSGQQPALSVPTMLYFCVPKNDKLLAYWDTVADRLFKIRHCMNIEGIARQLPLFEPPIEPGLLVKATAAGVDLSSVLNDLSAAPPHYRFNVLSQKATELCSELKALGQAMLSALEKRDGEHLSLLRAQHETALLALVEQVKKLQYDEAAQNKTALSKSRDTATGRYIHYQKLLGIQSPQVPEIGQPIPEGSPSQHIAIQEEGGIKTIPYEKEEMDKLKESDESQDKAAWTDFAASVANVVPNFNIEPWGIGATFGGSNVGSAISAIANRFRADSTEAGYEAGKSAKLSQYAMRAHDWLLQSNLAAREIMQIDQQILAAELRRQIADSELLNHRRQLANAREVEEYLSNKYTNQELYGWMIGQLATVYFQTYQLAYDLAKRAERAFRHELGLKDSNFIQFGYWDSLKKGLLAGERLFHDIKHMEAAYLEQNRREYEITKHISLAQLDALALVQLRQTATCVMRLPEVLFDIDFPGQYMRRIRSVSISIPCVAGPYTSVNCTLTLLNSSIRHGNTLLGGKYSRQEGDPRFTDHLGAIQSIVTSTAQNDSGMFETNSRDERFLPFEGMGAISEWQIELPASFRQFDYDTISDVILHIRYMAREGGTLLKQKATLELQTAVNEFIRSEGQQGLAQIFGLRHEFSNELYRLLNPVGETGDNNVTLQFTKNRFPFLFQSHTITIGKMTILIKVKSDFEDTHNDTTIKLTLAAGNTAPTSTNHQPADLLGLTLWRDLIHAEKVFNHGPGNWTINMWLDDESGPSRVNRDAIEDIIVVCQYMVG
jgi:hypothetical protein